MCTFQLTGESLDAQEKIRLRIKGALSILADFKDLREEGMSRQDYVSQLVTDLADCFGYLPSLAKRVRRGTRDISSKLLYATTRETFIVLSSFSFSLLV